MWKAAANGRGWDYNLKRQYELGGWSSVGETLGRSQCIEIFLFLPF
jgi:hypothetical protein